MALPAVTAPFEIPLLIRRACSSGQRLALLRQVEHDVSRVASVPSGACRVNVPSHLPVKLVAVWAASAGANAKRAVRKP